jgi:formylglycine-generating enzyme required for sulfatase activity
LTDKNIYSKIWNNRAMSNPKTSFFLGDTGVTMIYCPPGSFLMGNTKSDRDSAQINLEKPQHHVILSKGFWISETPITRRQFSVVNPQKLTHIYEDSLDSPASQHTWEEAIDFCDRLSGRMQEFLPHIQGIDSNQAYKFALPTEAQWEYACRAGTTTCWYFGDHENQLQEHAWYKMPSAVGKLPPVKLKKPNPWGLYDVYGMVYEWCKDDFTSYSKIEQVIDPVYVKQLPPTLSSGIPLASKVVRGGCIYDAATSCCSASRSSLISWNSENDLTGIRLVLNKS